MIDVEPIAFNTVATALRAAYSPISIYGEPTETPAAFPCVVLEQSDSSVYQKTQDGTNRENHNSLMFSLNVYSNLPAGSNPSKKMQAKAIMNIIDEQMRSMGFTRTMCSPVQNTDRKIYRITARYTAVVAAGMKSGENTVYQIYKR